MEKLQSQLPQPLKRCSPSRNADLLTQVRNTGSPAVSRSPARRTVTSSPNSFRSRGAEVKAPEVVARARDSTTPTRRPKYSPACTANGNMSPLARGKLNRQQQQQHVEVSDAKQSPVKTPAAKLPARTAPAQLRTLRSTAEPCAEDRYEREGTGPAWTPSSQSSSSATVSGIKKSLSPKWERRADVRKVDPAENAAAVEEEDKNNGGGGSPIYHELDPPGTCRFPAVQHTYQSIVEINDELESLKLAAAKPEAETNGRHLSRARSAQELTQKSPTRLSLFSRFRFGGKKSSTAARTKADRPDVSGQRSLQDADLIARSRDEVGVAAATHERQSSFSTFAAHRAPPPPPPLAVAAAAARCDVDGYSCVYVPSHSPQRGVGVGVSAPPRTSSLAAEPAPGPLYRQKFLRIASVHTLRSADAASRGGPALTASNSLGDLLLATADVGRGSPRRVTSYDDHAVATGSRTTTAAAAMTTSGGRGDADRRSLTARLALSPGRGATPFASPSCGVRMAAMRGAVRRGGGASDAAAPSPTRSPSASTPVPSPAAARQPVFQFSVPPTGVMLSPPVQRAFRHVSSQTVTSVRPPAASCVLSVTHLHSPAAAAAQMQTIEEEEDDSAGEDSRSAGSRSASVSAGSTDRHDRRTRRNETQRTEAANPDDVDESAQPSDKVAGQKQAAEDGCGTVDGGPDRRSSSEVAAPSRTSRLRRPSPSVAAKPLGSPLPEHHPSRIVPPSISVVQKRAESSSASPPSTPRSGGARGDSVRRAAARGPQRKHVAPPADNGDTTTTSPPPPAAGAVGDGLSVPGGRRRAVLLAPSGVRPSSTAESPRLLSSDTSSLSLPSADAYAGAAPEPAVDTMTSISPHSRAPADARILVQHKHAPSSVACRVARFSELTFPARTDQADY